MAQGQSIDNWKTDGGQLLVTGDGRTANHCEITSLPSKDELVKTLEHRQLIMSQLETAIVSLKRLAPNLV